MNMFDAAVLIIVGLSALLAFYRGFIRELMSLGGWLVASYVTLRFLEPATKLIKPELHSELIASGVAAIGLFFITLILFSVLCGSIIKMLKLGDKVGLADNLVGLTFGVARGLLIVSIGYFVMTKFFADEKSYPTAVKQSLTRPYIAPLAKQIATLAPAYLDRMGSDVKKQDAKDDMDDTKKKVNEFLDRAEGHARDAEKSIKAYDGKLEERNAGSDDEAPAKMPSIEDLQRRIKEENEKNDVR